MKDIDETDENLIFLDSKNLTLVIYNHRGFL